MKKKQSPDNGLISLVEFREFLFESIIPIEDLLDYKSEPISVILSFWRKKRLVPFIPTGRHKQSVSFADLIWLRILDTLREFSYPLDKLNRVCDYFFKDAYFNELPKQNFIYNKEMLLKKKLAGTISEQELLTLDFIEKSLGDDTFLYVLRYQINYLTNLIVNCLESREERAILIYKDGRVAELHGLEYYSHSDFIVDGTEPHIFISLSRLLREFIDDKDLSTLLIPQLLNEDEKRVLFEMKQKNVREITIRIQGGEVKKIESVKGGIITGEQAKEIKRILGLRNYEKIQIQTMDEKSLSFTKTKMKIK